MTARLLRRPVIALAVATGVMFWHGYETGARTSLRGVASGEDIATIAIVGFMLVLAAVVWGMMAWESRQGRTPPVRPIHVAVATVFMLGGLAAGMVGSALLGRIAR